MTVSVQPERSDTELAHRVFHVASDESSYVTAAVLPIDGGYTA